MKKKKMEDDFQFSLTFQIIGPTEFPDFLPTFEGKLKFPNFLVSDHPDRVVCSHTSVVGWHLKNNIYVEMCVISQ